MAVNNSFELFKDKGISGENQPKAPLIVVADSLSSPMNVGAVLRLAANLNAERTWLVYEQDPGFRSYKIKSTSSGASEKTDWEIIHPEKLPEVLPSDYEIIAIETTGQAQNIFTAKFPEKVVLIAGNERHGISEPVLKLGMRLLLLRLRRNHRNDVIFYIRFDFMNRGSLPKTASSRGGDRRSDLF